jgi:hypothetical protein
MTDPAPRNDFVSFPAPTEAILVALFIGLEMAEAFCARGLEVTVVEQAPAIMPTVDVELGRLLGEELRRHGVKLVNEVTVKAIHHDAGGLTVAGEPDFAATADLVLVVVGVRPDTQLAVAAGVQTGVRGPSGSTATCAPTSPTSWPPGTAWRPGIGCWRRPPICRWGLPPTSRAASPARPPSAATGPLPAPWGPRWSRCSSWRWPAPACATRTPGRPASTRSPSGRSSSTTRPTTRVPTSSTSVLPVIGERRLLGAQLVGHQDAEVAKRIDIPTDALFHHMSVDGLNELDLSYTPPFGSPWDAVQLAAQDWSGKRRLAPGPPAVL